MRQAFNGIATVLFDAGILTEQRLELLEKDVPALVWDSAIAGGWWRLASETHTDIFTERLGHYWVWRDDSRNWNMLFGAEAAEWQAKLLKVAAEETAAPAKPERRASPNVTEAVPMSGTDRADAQHNPDSEVTRRQRLLEDYKSATGNPPNKRIYEARNSGIHKPQFYQWLNGTLPADSLISTRFERFLREKKPPVPRRPRD